QAGGEGCGDLTARSKRFIPHEHLKIPHAISTEHEWEMIGGLTCASAHWCLDRFAFVAGGVDDGPGLRLGPYGLRRDRLRRGHGHVRPAPRPPGRLPGRRLPCRPA